MWPELWREWGCEDGRFDGIGVCLGETNGLATPLLLERSWRSCVVVLLVDDAEPGEGGTTSGVSRGEIGVKLKFRRRVFGLGGTPPVFAAALLIWVFPLPKLLLSDKAEGVSKRTLRLSSRPPETAEFFLAKKQVYRERKINMISWKLISINKIHTHLHKKYIKMSKINGRESEPWTNLASISDQREKIQRSVHITKVTIF